MDARRYSAGSSSPEVADDEEFFDEPMKKRASDRTADDRQSKPTADRPNDSRSQHTNDRSRRSSNGETSSVHSEREKRRGSTEVGSHAQRPGSSRRPVVIPSPTDHADDQVDRSRTSEDDKSTEKGSGKKRDRKKKKKLTRESKESSSDVSGASQHKKNDARSSASVSSNNKSGYSSGEEKRHSKDSTPTRSSADAKQSGTGNYQRAISAPARRPYHSRPVSGLNNDERERMDVKALLESVLLAEKANSRRKTASDVFEFRRRRNYTFSDDRLAAIERENKRLLERIMIAHYPCPSWATQKHAAPVKPVTITNVTRRKQQDKIEMDNLALLQRLKAAQPSRDICRESLLTDYNRRRAQYLGGSFYSPPSQSGHRRRAKSAPRHIGRARYDDY